MSRRVQPVYIVNRFVNWYLVLCLVFVGGGGVGVFLTFKLGFEWSKLFYSLCMMFVGYILFEGFRGMFRND